MDELSIPKRKRVSGTIAFTQWTADLFESRFGFEYRPMLTKLLSIQEQPISSQMVDFISQSIVYIIKAQSEIDLMNETSREDIIQTILTGTIASINQENGNKIVSLKREEYYSGEISVGKVEFMIKSHPVILMIIEAKKQDLSAGLLQNIMEVHQAAHLNKSNIPVYGAISTAEQWIFIRYDNNTPESMNNWSKSETFTLAPSSQDQDKIEAWRPLINKLTGMINWIIQQSITSV